MQLTRINHRIVFSFGQFQPTNQFLGCERARARITQSDARRRLNCNITSGLAGFYKLIIGSDAHLPNQGMA